PSQDDQLLLRVRDFTPRLSSYTGIGKFFVFQLNESHHAVPQNSGPFPDLAPELLASFSRLPAQFIPDFWALGESYDLRIPYQVLKVRLQFGVACLFFSLDVLNGFVEYVL